MNSLDLFIDELTGGLAKVPKGAADDVIQYYREYFDDARQAGRTDEQILARVGTARQVIASIMDEISIQSTQHNPNFFNLLKTSRRMLGKGAARAARSSSLALVSIFPLLGALVLYLAALVTLLAAPLSAAVLIRNLLLFPELPAADIMGQIGLIAILAAGLLALTFILLKGANGLARLTMLVFQKIANRAKPADIPAAGGSTRDRRPARVFLIILAALFLAGSAFAASNGLVLRYFQFWNSEQPADTKLVSQTLDASQIQKIKIKTLNTNVEIVVSQNDVAMFIYEQAPFYQFAWSLEGNNLTIQESANGKLPLVDYLAIHEGTTTLLVTLPAELAGLDLEIETAGGDTDIRIPCQYVKVSSYSGDIRMFSSDGSYSGELNSIKGQVKVISK